MVTATQHIVAEKVFKNPAAEVAYSESVNALAKLDIKAVRELKAL